MLKFYFAVCLMLICRQHADSTQTTHRQHADSTQTTRRQHADSTQTTRRQHADTHKQCVTVRSYKHGKQECETLRPCCNKFYIFKPQVPYKNQITTGMMTSVAVDDCAMGALG
jgi:hypothetical protein